MIISSFLNVKCRITVNYKGAVQPISFGSSKNNCQKLNNSYNREILENEIGPKPFI